MLLTYDARITYIGIGFLYAYRLRNTCSYSVLLCIATCFCPTELSSGNIDIILRKLLY
jgi:hypothetical protein